MPEYHAPLDDIRFVLDNVTPISDLAKLGPYAHADAERWPACSTSSAV